MGSPNVFVSPLFLKNSSVFVSCKKGSTCSQASSSCPCCITSWCPSLPRCPPQHCHAVGVRQELLELTESAREPAAPCLFTRLPTHEDSLCNMSLGQVWRYPQVLKSAVWPTAWPIPFQFSQPYVKSRTLQSKAEGEREREREGENNQSVPHA